MRSMAEAWGSGLKVTQPVAHCRGATSVRGVCLVRVLQTHNEEAELGMREEPSIVLCPFNRGEGNARQGLETYLSSSAVSTAADDIPYML